MFGDYDDSVNTDAFGAFTEGFLQLLSVRFGTCGHDPGQNLAEDLGCRFALLFVWSRCVRDEAVVYFVPQVRSLLITHLAEPVHASFR